MKSKPLPPLDLLKLKFRHDEMTGILFWTDNSRMSDGRKSKCAGKPAGTIKPNGYIYVHVFKKILMAHRIIWALHHGHDPHPLDIDHVNGIRHDNRILNMRLATTMQNCRNKKLYRTNNSGMPGVRWKKNKWQVRISIDGMSRALGTYSNKIYAGVVYARAAKLYFGQFRRKH
jgi:hypothetical protein